MFSTAYYRVLPFAIVLTALTYLARAQSVRNVATFTGNGSQGNASAPLTQGRTAQLYGASSDPKGTAGSLFGLKTSGRLSTLYIFDFSSGSDPVGATLGTDGNFYGVADAGGTGTYGVLFRVNSNGAYTTLYNFEGGSSGGGPGAPPIEASDGNFYGATNGAGGIFESTVYKYSPSGALTTLYTFNTSQADSVGAALIEGSDGNLYGTSPKGGAYDYGSIFKLSKRGSLLFLYSFPGFQSGAFPYGPLVQASNGYYYGTTYSGGTGGGNGTVYKMDSKGNVTILYSFTAHVDGANPFSGLVQGTDGNLYGTTSAKGSYGYGTLFKISLDGKFTSLYSFDSTIGEYPASAPLQHTDGLFYGTLPYGSTYDYGAVYSLDMGLAPFITFVQPTGKAGGTAEILGQKLTGTTAVTFNGIPASSFKVFSDTYMTAVVPASATTGKVMVTTPAGPLTSNVNFRIVK